MYRICILSGQPYAYKFQDLNQELENIETFVDEGTPVLIVKDLEDVIEFDLVPDEITIAN